MNPNIPILGIRFDIDKAGGGYYGLTCWRTLWEALEPMTIAGTFLFEGDSRATLNGHERVFLIALQAPHSSKLKDVQQTLSQDPAFLKMAANPPFASDVAVAGEPLVEAGSIDSGGNLVGQAHASGSALGDVQRSRRKTQQTLDDSAVSPRVAPASSRSAGLPDISSIEDLEKVLVERFSPRSLYKYAYIWISPEELCDVVDRYDSQLHVQWDEYGQSTLAIDLFWREPRCERRLQFRSFQKSPSPVEALRSLREGWEIAYQEGGPIRNYLDRLPEFAGLDGCFQRNFRGEENGGLLKDYNEDKHVSAQELWPRLCRQFRQMTASPPSAAPQAKAREAAASTSASGKRWWQFWS